MTDALLLALCTQCFFVVRMTDKNIVLFGRNGVFCVLPTIKIEMPKIPVTGPVSVYESIRASFDCGTF